MPLPPFTLAVKHLSVPQTLNTQEQRVSLLTSPLGNQNVLSMRLNYCSDASSPRSHTVACSSKPRADSFGSLVSSWVFIFCSQSVLHIDLTDSDQCCVAGNPTDGSSVSGTNLQALFTGRVPRAVCCVEARGLGCVCWRQRHRHHRHRHRRWLLSGRRG